jgi:undecaprenyl pyrophosphate synthase
LDAIGHNVFFGFKFQGDTAITFAVSHGGLAEIILYLQRIADEAQQRRLSLDPLSRK